jgi:hypothetical protein
MGNMFDKAYETAAELTHKWIDENLNNGIHVTENEIAAKFGELYEEAVLNTKIDVLTF